MNGTEFFESCNRNRTGAAMRSKLTILLDENLLELETALRLKGFKVITLDQGLSDRHIQQIAEGTAILTKNTKDFVKNAKAYDYDIISLDNLKFIDSDKTDKNQTTEKIAEAVRESEFYNKRGNWLLSIYSDKPWSLKELVI